MLFKPELAQAILDGRKTVTRRPVIDDTPCRYAVGATYAVQPGRGKQAIGRMRVTSVSREPFRPLDLSDDELAREGFSSLSGFLGAWARIYNTLIQDEVWRIEFEAVADAAA